MKLKFLLAMICLTFFAVIAGFVVLNEPLTFDASIQHSLFSSRGDALTLLFRGITYTANWQSITAFCVVLLLWPKTTVTYGLPLSGCAILSSIAYKLLKSLFQRPRPEIALHLITQGGYSFPSGHSMTGLLFYGLLVLLLRRQLLSGNGMIPSEKQRTAAFLLTVLLVCLIFLIGISRIYLGVHYPSDVLGGWFFGGFLLILFSSFALRQNAGSEE